MADFGAPVAQNVNVNPNQGMQTLSGIMTLKQQQLGLQKGAADVQSAQAQAQGNQQQMQERQAFTQMLKSGVDDQGNSIRTPDGDIDPTKVVAAQGRIAPVYGSQWSSGIIQAHTDKVALQSASQSLDQKGRGMIAGPLQAAALSPTDENIANARSAITQIVDAHPETGPAANHTLSLLDHISQIPAVDASGKPDLSARTKHLTQLSAYIQPAQTVGTQSGAGQVDVGSGVQSGTFAPAAAENGGAFTPATTTGKGVAPGANTFTDARTGNIYAYNPQDPSRTILVGQGGKLFEGSTATAPVTPTGSPAARGGAGAPAAGSPGAAPSPTPTGAANPNAPPIYSPGEAGIVEKNTANINANRQAAQDALTQRDILGRIQTLASSGVYLGPGSSTVADLATRAAQIPGFEGAAKYANNYNELIKFMAQNAARQGASLGLTGSDARLEAVQHANPNADPMDARTVQNVSQYIGGLVRMNQAKADAMDTWLQQPGNSAKNEHQFEANWRNNADPRLFQMAEMQDQGAAGNYAAMHVKKSEAASLGEKHDWLVSVGALPRSAPPAAAPATPPQAEIQGNW
jgi:hypothetical protein